MFELKLSVFQGPLDLLLDLIEREELDITAVSLAQVTEQYWAHLRSGEGVDPTALAEFIVVGARLLYIKSRHLLPEVQPRQREEEREDTGEALAQMLVEYKRFREAAEAFRELEEQGRRAYPRLAPPSKDFLLPPGLKGVTLEGLLNIFQEALSRQPAEPEEGAIERETVTVEEKMAAVMEAVADGSGRVSFRAVVEACSSRLEVIVVFLAVLELMKASQLTARQRGPFREIMLTTTEAVTGVSP